MNLKYPLTDLNKCRIHMEVNIFKKFNPESSTGYLLWQISNLRQRKINTELIDIQLTYPQFVVLVGIHWLQENKETVNQVLLINYTKMDKSVVSSVLKLLEKKSYVNRETAPQDTRSKTLTLSNNGINKLDEAMETIQLIDKKLFNNTILGLDQLNGFLLKTLTDNEL